MDQTVDVSWPQQNFNADASENGVIVAATSGDSSNLFTQSTFVEDITNARNAGKECGFYHFNGPQDAVSSANFFWSIISKYYQPGDLLALDIESGSFFGAQSPDWALAFATRLAQILNVTVAELHLGIYGNISTMSRTGWGALERAGCWLWLAAPGGYPENTPIGEWSHWTILQYSSAGNVDRDESQLTFSQIMGADMPLTPADISALLNFPAYTNGPSISQVLKNLNLLETQQVLRDGKYEPQIQDEADTGTIVREIQAKVDTLESATPGAVDNVTLVNDIKQALQSLALSSTSTTTTVTTPTETA